MYYVVFRDIWSAGSTDEADRQTDRQIDREYSNISSITHGLLVGKFLKSRPVTSSCCSRVLVCLPVAFKFLNRVTFLQIHCEHYDDFGVNHEALGSVCRYLVLTKWRACELLRCESLFLASHILCANGQWRNVQISLSLYRYRMRNLKMAKVEMLFKCSITMIIDDCEQVRQIFWEVKLYIHTYTLHTK